MLCKHEYMRWWKLLLIILGCVVVIMVGLVWYIKHPALVSAVDETNLPKFIQADFIDLDRVASISKFRSASGHDFSGHGEICRSMKHYFSPPYDPTGQQYSKNQTSFPAPDPATAIPIYSPVDGRIVSISEEHTPIGKQFSIRPTSNPSYTIRLFHVYPVDGIRFGMQVKAGQQLGIIGANQGTDIAVQASTLHGDQFVSYFQVLPDSVFANYQKRGLLSRDDVILTKAYRDAHPLECTGNRSEEFAKQYQADPGYDEEVYLSGYSKPMYDRTSAEQKQDSSGDMHASECSVTVPAEARPPGCQK